MPTGFYVRTKETREKMRARMIGNKFGFQVGNHPKTEIKKGQHLSASTEFQKGQHIGREHPKWKGKKVGYYALHSWVIRHKGNPKQCKHCGKNGKMLKRFWSIDWANIDHKYRRNLDDFIGLCKDCHKKYDLENGFYTPKNQYGK